jgi:8-oxo-dGTP pyrophosphatase MutT (NUDIX family)
MSQYDGDTLRTLLLKILKGNRPFHHARTNEGARAKGVSVRKTNPWRLLSREERYECAYFSARHDIVSIGRSSDHRTYSSVRMKSNGVCCLPIDRRGSVTLVGQYRYVLDRFTWEVPGGGCPLGKDPLKAAKAELTQETGCRALHWLKLVEGCASPGISTEVVPGFVAWGLRRGRPKPDPQERLFLRTVSLRVAVDMALEGKIGNLAGSALLLALRSRLADATLPPPLATLAQRGLELR